MTIDCYDPPGFMADFAGISGQLDQCSAAVSGWFSEVITYEENSLHAGDSCQHYSQLEWQPTLDKVNSRSTENDQGGCRASFNRRILRCGLLYGDVLPLGGGEDPAAGEWGLLFICCHFWTGLTTPRADAAKSCHPSLWRSHCLLEHQ